MRPEFCDTLERIAQATEARVWRGSGLPTDQMGIRVLDTPLGHRDFVAAHLRNRLRSHQTLLDRITEVPDLQSAWALLFHCASALSNYLLRVVRPESGGAFTEGHDAGLWACLCRLVNVNTDTAEAKVIASIPLSLGGLGLRSATRTRHSAFWASWVGSLSMIKERHFVVTDWIVGSLTRARPAGPCLRSAAIAAHQLRSVEGFETPSWEAFADGLRPPSHDPEDIEPGGVRHGWQHEAASRVERHHRDRVFMPTLADPEKALLRSQSCPYSGVALSVAPINFLTRIDASLFRVLLLRRLRFPLPLSLRFCRCGRPLDSFGHHRAACSRAGLLGRRGSVESAAARVCREAGVRVAMNVLVRDMDLALPNAHDARRLEILADGLPLFGGAQLAVDTTGVSFGAMGLPDLVPPTQTGLPWLRPDARRNTPVRSWSVPDLVHALWFLLGKSAAVGQRKLRRWC